jgi:CHAT domain-containing protein
LDSDIQFSFEEQVTPVYKEYLKLLLAGKDSNLAQVVQVNEQLQVAELENYLQCGLQGLERISTLAKITPLQGRTGA